MALTAPITIDEFKAYFDRDFMFGPATESIRDKDIQKALDAAAMMFDPAHWASVDQQKTAFEYLTAHCLVRSIDAGGGLVPGNGAKSTGSSPVISKLAGPLKVRYSLPQSIMDDPKLALFLTTGYGQLYLQMLVPTLTSTTGTTGAA